MNVVLIVVDALRRRDVGCYGRDDDITPSIDRIAQEGIVYENAIAQSNYTDVCLSSIMSGKTPRGHGVKNHGASYTEESLAGIQETNTEFLPQTLSENGYTTIGLDWLGRWHKWGYDEYGVETNDGNGTIELLKSGIKRLPDPIVNRVKNLRYHFGGVPDPRADCEELTDKAIDAFKRHSEDTFLFLHYWDVHPPFLPPDRFADDFSYEGENRDLSYYFQPDRKGKRGGEYAAYVNGLRDTLSESKSAYDGTVAWVDEQIGRLYEYLDEAGRLEETLFIVTADHGHYFGEHDIFSDNCSLYDPSIRIPLVVHLPKAEPDRIEGIVQHTDIRPTIHDFYGLSQPDDIRGNVLPGELREYGFAEAVGGRMQMIRTRDWKLIEPLDIDHLRSQYWYDHDGKTELYDLEADPGETTNVAEDNPKKVAELKKLLEQELEQQRQIERNKGRGERQVISDEEIDEIQSNLESLGYVEDG